MNLRTVKRRRTGHQKRNLRACPSVNVVGALEIVKLLLPDPLRSTSK
jgi:hypothetical protein